MPLPILAVGVIGALATGGGIAGGAGGVRMRRAKRTVEEKRRELEIVGP